MSRRANPAVVGAFVVGALVLTVVGVLVFGGGALLRERFPVVAFFSGNVRGLQEGSAVEFRGVRVGTVTGIRLVLDRASAELLIPVHMELEPDSLSLLGAPPAGAAPDPRSFLEQLVGEGLRARLDLKSFVTGQRTVTLDMFPGTSPVRVGVLTGVYELPTVPSTLDRFTQEIQDLPLQEMAAKLSDALAGVERLVSDPNVTLLLRDAAATTASSRALFEELARSVGPTLQETRDTLREARAALQEVRGALAEYTRLARTAGERLDALAGGADRTLEELGGIRATLDARVAPVAEAAAGTLENATRALDSVRDLMTDSSRTRYNLDVALEEIAAAARSLRILADYLEQHPDALLRGKGR